MTPEQKRLVQSSFEQVAPISELAASLFYERLFELDPRLRHLFKGDLQEQGRKLMQMLGVVLKGLDRPDELTTAAQALGKRHVAYGVKDEDYETVGAALLWTLGKGLGAAFTTEVKDAWAAAYTLLAGSMKADAVSCPAATSLPEQVGGAAGFMRRRSHPTADSMVMRSRRRENPMTLRRVE